MASELFDMFASVRWFIQDKTHRLADNRQIDEPALMSYYLFDAVAPGHVECGG
jgi:hypothetical protein